MTSTSINEVKSFFMGNVSSHTKSQEVQSQESFSKVFDKTQKPEENVSTNVNAKKSEDAESIQNHAKLQKNNKSDNLKDKTEDVGNVIDVEDMEEAAENAACVMVEEVAKSFEITVEDVKAVLDELGLTELDLLNSENLTKVVLALNPDMDAFSLMTNEEMFGKLKSLMNLAKDLNNQMAGQFQLSEDDMAKLLQTIKEQMNSQNVSEQVQESANNETSQLSEVVAKTTSEMIPMDVEVDFPEEVLNESKVNTYAREANKLTDTTEGFEATVLPKADATESSKRGGSEAGNDFGQNTGQSFQQQFVNQLANAVEQASGTGSTYGVSGQEILQQITDYMKLHVNAETTEMEMQLHPASLGNIKVQLVSTEGVLSAIFTTENETVKAALESQLVQLKENFAQQGLKVESVEVNVSAQGFERSLDQQEQQGQNQFENSNSKKGNRRIRLDGMTDGDVVLAEDIPADDRIVADMMIRNGNSVDYTV
ncbi:MAG: flagellar hook-length control protein FliK [Lachnospiraceae bacterium]|nr:flagellar hook-length control protein FliK [Lachnospiraceae bacterium]